MKIDSHISELLYDHDCVIVPSFGGFLASYSHAKIHPAQHAFSPPSKKIAFNIFLKQNDGLLANYISDFEKLTYADANNRIEQQVKTWQKELSEGKKLVIDRIGTFYFDAEKNLQFDPVKNINYLRDAFGLGRVHYFPVVREEAQQSIEKQVREIISIRPSSKQQKKIILFSRKKKSRTLNILIIAGSVFWISFNLYLITPGDFNLSSLNPFSSENRMETVKPVNVEATPVTKEAVPAPPAHTETVYVEGVTPLNPTPTSTETEKKTEISAPVTSVAPISTPAENQKYFVIGGAFEIRENADAFVKTLKAEGFSDARILDTTEHLKKVCFRGFETRFEAIKEAARLKALDRNAWIYKL